MATAVDPIALTQTLVQLNTINPPGNEQAVCEHLTPLLRDAGFETQLHPFGEARANLVATLPATERRHPALVFSGHVDTVPLGVAPWLSSPLAGEITNGRLYGRGSSDMKSGVAAMVAAAQRLAALPERHADITLVISAAEETGSEGVAALVQTQAALGDCGLLVVAEPTDNYPMLGHKGALWAELEFSGVTAHGAMPELGESALYKACRAVELLRTSGFHIASHPILGEATFNVGYLHSGANLNSVPDSARLGMDLRTLPEQTHPLLLARIREQLDDESLVINPLVDLPAVFSDPNHPLIQLSFSLAEPLVGGRVEPQTARYFTDASVLTPAYGDAPTLIMGPGVMRLAHQTDEYCEVEAIEECTAYFQALGEAYLQR